MQAEWVGNRSCPCSLSPRDVSAQDTGCTLTFHCCWVLEQRALTLCSLAALSGGDGVEADHQALQYLTATAALFLAAFFWFLLLFWD